MQKVSHNIKFFLAVTFPVLSAGVTDWKAIVKELAKQDFYSANQIKTNIDIITHDQHNSVITLLWAYEYPCSFHVCQLCVVVVCVCACVYKKKKGGASAHVYWIETVALGCGAATVEYWFQKLLAHG